MTVLSSTLHNSQDEPDHLSVDVVRRQNSATESVTSSHLPVWVDDLKDAWGEALQVPEWEDDEQGEGGVGSSTDDDDGSGSGGAASMMENYRSKHGWRGRDLIHDKDSPVRILNYYVKYGEGRLVEDTNTNTNTDDNTTKAVQQQPTFSRGGFGTVLTGVVHFTKRAESHMGYCHGGSMTSVLDDVIGWVAFLTTGECRPWSGYTVQVNCSLKRPIAVDSVLLVQAKITHIERRKVSVEATIIDPSDSSSDNNNDDNSVVVHASATGLVVLNRGVMPEQV